MVKSSYMKYSILGKGLSNILLLIFLIPLPSRIQVKFQMKASF